MPTDYHREWNELYGGKPVELVHEEVIKPILEQNELYQRRKHKEGNRGLMDQVKEFDRYLAKSVHPPQGRKTMYAETGYLFWLFGIRLKDEYPRTLDHRIKSFLQGAAYPGEGLDGFRQAEYELHCIARLVEEGISVQDNELLGLENTPDLTLDPDGISVFCEVKMPTSGSKSAISKALSQIGEAGGGVILGFDFIMAEAGYSMEAFCDAFANVREAVQDKDVFAFVEYLNPEDAVDGSYIATTKGEGFSQDAYDMVYQAMVRQR